MHDRGRNVQGTYSSGDEKSVHPQKKSNCSLRKSIAANVPETKAAAVSEKAKV